MHADPRMRGLTQDTIAMVHAGARALRDGHLQQAATLLTRAHQQAPKHAEPLRYLAIAQLHNRQAQLAQQTLLHALSFAPEDALLHSDLGTAQAACGNLEAALDAWRQACALDPNQATAWFNLGRNLQQLGQTSDAVSALEHVVKLTPQAIPAHILLGDACVHLGAFQQAATHYRAALSIYPACGDAWRGLSNIKTVTLTEKDAQHLQQQLARKDIADSDRIAMGYALGKVEEDAQHYAAAFTAFGNANALQQRLTPWSLAAFEQFLQHMLTASHALPAPLNPQLGQEIIFIVGLPRSGSTLFEQILSAHPDVEGASELNDLGVVIQQESQRRGLNYPQWVPHATADDWHRLGQTYLQRTARWRAQHPRMTDKQPDNWKHAGILRAMLPGATVIQTQRAPLETAWSCFKQQFYSQPHFANAFTDIAAYIHGCSQAMQQWRAQDPGHIYLHQYEDLLAAPEAHTHLLLEHCKLAFSPACLTFYQHHRSVRTASAAQVRQPLASKPAITRAYGALLQPLRSALQTHHP